MPGPEISGKSEYLTETGSYSVVAIVSGLVCSMIFQLFVHVDLGDFDRAASQFRSTNLLYPQQSAPATFAAGASTDLTNISYCKTSPAAHCAALVNN